MRAIVKVSVGWILGLIQEPVRLAQQHKKEEKMGPYREFRSMRKSVVSIIALATLAFIAGEARAATMTEQQVRNSCAGTKNFQETDAGFSCTKACGANGESVCYFGCAKDKNGKAKDCEGVAVRNAGDPGSPTGPASGAVRQPRPGGGMAIQGEPPAPVPPGRVKPPATTR